MSYQPVVPFGGNAGWSFLQRTRESQQEAFNSSSTIERNVDAFRSRISSIVSAQDLVNDRELLGVALGAFGLDEDIQNKFFIKKVLEEGTLNDEAFANKLSDKRYFALAEAFGFDLTPPRTVLSSFPDEIISAYQDRQFELAIGNTAPDMRLALSAERELPAILGRNLSETATWFTIMANPPMRAFFERAFNLPSTIGALDLDKQLELFKDRAERFFGPEGIRQFSEESNREALVRRFLASSEISAGPSASAPGSTALALLQSGGAPQSGLLTGALGQSF